MLDEGILRPGTMMLLGLRRDSGRRGWRRGVEEKSDQLSAWQDGYVVDVMAQKLAGEGGTKKRRHERSRSEVDYEV
jgi:hypothetical protein